MNSEFTQLALGAPLWRWLALATAVTTLLLVASWMRNHFNIDWSIDSLRALVQSLGVWGPLSYIGILMFRFLFLIPSSLLLIASGVLFGPVNGALYAGFGLLGSAIWKYGLISLVGQQFVLSQLPSHLQTWVNHFAQRKTSIWALGGICAYPFLPKHIFQFGAILSGMGLVGYLVAVSTGSFIRAGTFAWLGQALYSNVGIATTTLAFIVLLALPMCIPTCRHWMLAPLSQTKTNSIPLSITLPRSNP